MEIDTPIFFVTDFEVLNVRDIVSAVVITGEDHVEYRGNVHEGLKTPFVEVNLKGRDSGETWWIEHPHSLEFMAFMKTIAANRT